MNHLTTTAQTTEEDLLARAKKRVDMKVGFFTHALVFVLVNLGLYLITNRIPGVRWAEFPMWGWGLGLAIHGVVTFLALTGEGLRERMLSNELAHLRTRR